MTDRQDYGQPPWDDPQQGYGQQYPQGQPWQPQQYNPGTHQRRMGGQQYAPQGQPPQAQPPFPPQGQPWPQPGYQAPQGPPGWQQPGYGQQSYGQPSFAPPQPGYQPGPQRPRKSWPARHKILTVLGAAGTLLIIVVVLAALSSGATPTPGTTGLAACRSHHAVTERDWLVIAKDPDAHKGECIIVYGEVTQFDSSTGTGMFRASAAGVKVAPEFGFADYPTNTMLSGSTAALGGLVEGDLFTASVTVAGHVSYDTQLGGSTTAPVLRVDSVTRTGHLTS